MEPVDPKISEGFMACIICLNKGSLFMNDRFTEPKRSKRSALN